jgi:hypothetical protein
MQPRLELLPSWTAQLQGLLPDLRLTRLRVLALFSLGLVWAETTTLGRIAATLPLTAHDLSTERRLRRWLANPTMAVVPTWQPLLSALVARLGQREVLVVFDPTPYRDAWTILMLSLVVHRRTVPLAWHVVPQQERWPQPTWRYLERLCQRVAQALPPGVTVTLLADRGLTSAGLIDLCSRLGWHDCLRRNAGPHHGPLARRPDGTTAPVWDLVGGPGQRWEGRVALFQEAGWRTVHLTIRWPRHATEPWLLVSDRPPGTVRVAEYRRRVHCEAFYQDTKSRGWHLEASRLTDRNRLNRLLLVLALAAWWVLLLGQQVIRRGLRRQFDRRHRRDVSLLRLGRRWVQELLDHDALPPLPFRYHAGHWSLRWVL